MTHFQLITLRALICSFFICNAPMGYANSEEIQHLIDFVAQTPCRYERNGREYSGKEAVEHIKKKYHYFSDEIKTSEDFIELSASKSTMSGKRYLVHCGQQQTQTSQQWLLDELQNFRKTRLQ